MRKETVRKMKEVKVLLDRVDRVKRFVSITSKFDADMELIYGRYIINAKSIMGIFSMDLAQQLILRIHEGKENVEDIIEAIKEYVAE